MIGRDFWEGTAIELLSMIDSGELGIPKDGTRLSGEIMKPHTTDASQTYGLTVERERTASRRLLVFSW